MHSLHLSSSLLLVLSCANRFEVGLKYQTDFNVHLDHALMTFRGVVIWMRTSFHLAEQITGQVSISYHLYWLTALEQNCLQWYLELNFEYYLLLSYLDCSFGMFTLAFQGLSS